MDGLTEQGEVLWSLFGTLEATEQPAKQLRRLFELWSGSKTQALGDMVRRRIATRAAALAPQVGWGLAMVKALEEKGVTKNPDEFMKYLNAMTQAAIATGGRVTPEQFFQTILYGRQAAQGWDLSFIGGALPRLIFSQ